MDDVKALFDYALLASDKRLNIDDVDAVMQILYEVLNTNKSTIRVAKQNKPAAVVIGKIMKLTSEEIHYAIQKYSSVTGRITDPKAYMLTLLYGAKEQMTLDVTNEVMHDIYGTDDAE